MKMEIGNKIRWKSSAGVLTGVVKSIKLDMNAAKQVCPWILVEDVENWVGMTQSNVMLNGNDGYLKMMRVEVLQ
jgi:hypothetical protein